MDEGVTQDRLPLSVDWRDGALWLLDQTHLPHRVEMICPRSVEEVHEAIRSLRVRGAPAIGIAAAYGVLAGIAPNGFSSCNALREEIERRVAYLATARPTAVNLFAALERMSKCVRSAERVSAEDLYADLLEEARGIHEEDRRLCRAIGLAGLPLIAEGSRVLTHCNAGALAVSELGTALAPLYLAHREGRALHVYVDETRPLLQGARLTAWELQQAGIEITLICDNMAAQLFAKGAVDLVIVGTDRVVANGDVANKIGTLGLAVLAHYYSVPFYVACPGTTVDLNLASGAEIEIEMRDPDEVRTLQGTATAPPGVNAINPAFDVTPHDLITGLITDRGIIGQPLAAGLREKFGAVQ